MAAEEEEAAVVVVPKQSLLLFDLDMVVRDAEWIRYHHLATYDLTTLHLIFAS